MVHELISPSLEESLTSLTGRPVVWAAGMGQKLYRKRRKRPVKPMLWGCGRALNLLAINPDKRHNRVITPHPGEAARLLGCSVAEIESATFTFSTKRLAKRYGGVVVLKGAVNDYRQRTITLAIIDAGNAGMAMGGWAITRSPSAHCSTAVYPMMRSMCGMRLTARRRDPYWQRYACSRHAGDRSFTTLRRIVNPDVIGRKP